jgi:hypothetical protein
VSGRQSAIARSQCGNTATGNIVPARRAEALEKIQLMGSPFFTNIRMLQDIVPRIKNMGMVTAIVTKALNQLALWSLSPNTIIPIRK